jgi:alpha-amylase
MTEIMNPPVLFTFGLHAHQPDGNFGHVFEEHLRDVYEPFVRRAVDTNLLPITLHLSGPLLDWLEVNASSYLDLIGELATTGRVELLLAGYFEPILPSLLREDRLEQIQWMREFLRNRFGVEARGLWLTERVWEPDLASDLVDAGVEYVLVDDRHFVASGFPREVLHAPFRTEASGKSLGVFAIDEKLRYLIPFHAPEETAAYLRYLRESGHRLAVAADDIEKFGGWPGTREWVYDRGWMERFTRTIKDLEEGGVIRLSTFSSALDELPSGGLAYLPSASYREMEEWSLPSEAHHRLSELKAILGEERFARGESPLIRGSHWRNFFVKYPEANRMHKKMLALSSLCRARGNAEAPRRALGRAQCNDAYWHGVFGGLYLRHIRDTVWRNLAEAEGLLRRGEALGWEAQDLDMDGHVELWVHSSEFSALVSPRRGGAVEELTIFRAGVNLANTLTRRREPYHEAPGNETGTEEPRGERHHEGAPEGNGGSSGDGSGPTDENLESAPSIHDLEEGLHFSELPPVDRDDRAIFVERVLRAGTTESDFRLGRFLPLRSWAREALELGAVTDVTPSLDGDVSNDRPESSTGGHPHGPSESLLEIRFSSADSGALDKTLRFRSDGSLEVLLSWDPSNYPSDAIFTTELSLGARAEIHATPDAEVWRFPISTSSKSERGLDETVQGEGVLVRWPIAAGASALRLRPG